MIHCDALRQSLISKAILPIWLGISHAQNKAMKLDFKKRLLWQQKVFGAKS